MTSRYILEHNEVDLDLTITSNNIQIFMMIYDFFIHFITVFKFHSIISPSIQFFCPLLEFISCLRSFVAILFCYEISERFILVMTLHDDSFVFHDYKGMSYYNHLRTSFERCYLIHSHINDIKWRNFKFQMVRSSM